MRTTIDIPTDLLRKAMELTQARTKREVVIRGLEELVSSVLRKRLLARRGTNFIDLTQEELERMRADD